MSFFTLLRARPLFFRLWASSAVSLIGDWLSFVSVSLLSLESGGGPLALALVFAAHALPHALFAPFAGVFADRFDRRRLLIFANLAEAALTFGMAAAALLGWLPLVQVLLFARSALGAFVVPAETAALRRVVEKDELLTANSLVAGTWSLMFVLGMALGGLLAGLGPAVALGLDGATFVLAALLLRGLPAIVPEVSRRRGVFAELQEAWQYATERGPLLRSVLAKTPLALAAGGAWVTLNLVASGSAALGTAALSLGVFQAVRGAGTGIGPLLASRLARAGRSVEGLLAASLGISLFGMAAFALGGSLPWLLVVLFLWGVGAGSNWVLSSAEMQRLAPDALTGRLAAIDDLCLTVGQVFSALVGAAIAVHAGPVAATWVGLALGGFAWIALTLASRRPAPAAVASA